jgi:ABC-type lipoprotein release transport system permease subunit
MNAGRAFFVYEIRPHDPTTIVTVAVLLFGTALAATLIPARRAARVEPIVALRHD